MRDPLRIARILTKLAQVWYQNKDMRLGQMIYNLCRPNEENIFNIEDDVIEERLKKVVKEGWSSVV